MQKFWCCYVEGTGGFSFKHMTLNEALEEAERLTRQSKNAGKVVYLLEAVEYCRIVQPVPPVEWAYTN